MKNKILLSLALLFTAQFATPTSALTWDEVQPYASKAAQITGTAALVAGKTIFGVAALCVAISIPIGAIVEANEGKHKLTSIKMHFDVEETHALTNLPVRNTSGTIEVLPTLYLLAGAGSLCAGYAGYRALASAWNDIKTINS